MTLTQLNKLATDLHSHLDETSDLDTLNQRAADAESNAEDASCSAGSARDAADEVRGGAEQASSLADEAQDFAQEAKDQAQAIRGDLETLEGDIDYAKRQADEITAALANLSAGLTEDQEDAIRRADVFAREAYAGLGFKDTAAFQPRRSLRKHFPDLFKDEPAETQEEVTA